MKRIILFSLLGGMLAASSGCGLCQAVFCYRPCIGCGDCAACGCGDGCGEDCGPACGPTRCAARPCAVRLAVRGPVAIATRAAKRNVAGRAARLAAGAAAPAVIRVGTRAAMGAASVAGIGDRSVAYSPCSRRFAGGGGDVASDIAVISTATRPIVGTRATATATTRAADAIRAGVDATIVAAVMSTRAPTASGERIISQTDQAVGPTARATPQPHKAVRPEPEQ